jgi:hypothetical protein
LELRRHREKPINAEEFTGRIFEFKDKPGARIYHPSPVRVYLVHNIDGKWLYWGKIAIIEQTIQVDNLENKKTSGKFKIIEIFDPDYQEQITKHEAPDGNSYL